MTEGGESDLCAQENDKVFFSQGNSSSRNQMKFSLCELFANVKRKKRHEDNIYIFAILIKANGNKMIVKVSFQN